jgi:hypothetical protein
VIDECCRRPARSRAFSTWRRPRTARYSRARGWEPAFHGRRRRDDDRAAARDFIDGTARRTMRTALRTSCSNVALQTSSSNERGAGRGPRR